MRYYSFLFLIVLGFLIVMIVPSADAATTQVNIMPGSGSGQNCEQTSTCFNPSLITIFQGDTVTWTNGDNVVHDIVDGLPFSGKGGMVFNSGPIAPTKAYSHTFQDVGNYRYFDTDSKWMVGKVIVKQATASSAVPEFGGMAAFVLSSVIAGVIMLARKIQL